MSNFSIDWLNFTFKNWEVIDTDRPLSVEALFCEWFPEFVPEFEKSNALAYSNGIYQCTVRLSEYIYFHYDIDDKHKGYNVEIPSHGLSHFFDLLGISSHADPVQECFEILFSRHCQLSRLDIAFDDYSYRENGFTSAWYHKMWSNGWTRSRCRAFSYISDGNKAGTVYFGTRANGKLLRVYDKYLESKGLVDAVRYEAEFHNHYCNDFAQKYINNEVSSFADILTSFIEIIDLEKYPSNKSLCPLLPEWKKWLELKFNVNIKPLSFPKPKKDTTYFLEKKRQWLETTALNSIVFVYHCLGSRIFNELYKDIEISDLPPYYQRAFENYKNKLETD